MATLRLENAVVIPVRMRTAMVMVLVSVSAGCSVFAGCGAELPKPASSSPPAKASPVIPPAPAADTTGGFDGARAYAHVQQLVAIGPREPGSEGIRRAQTYIRSQLEGFHCTVEEDTFTAQTPRGDVRMKNIVAKVPGSRPEVVLFLTHYDTVNARLIPGFVGANDSGSSTGVMLELARLLCGRTGGMTVWIAFLDGEEAFVEWSERDSVYGSRQLAARLSNSGDLKRIKAVILADLVGYRDLRFLREESSTKWLTDVVWSTASRLGYGQSFVAESTSVEDDHTPFLRRNVPAVDIIQLNDYPHWHSVEDTLDKISPRSLAIVGHVLVEVLPQLEKKIVPSGGFSGFRR